MAGHKELIKTLSEDESLRQQILNTPSREGKQEAVRNAGLEVPDHHDVLQEVAGGMDDSATVAIGGAAGFGGFLAGAAAAAAALV